MDFLEQYYNKFKEDKRLNTRHGRLEFITSMKYIHECLDMIEDNHKRILDVGAGTGRYSVELAKEGYAVTALEYVQHNVDIIKSKKTTVRALQGTAVDLSRFEDEYFDLTLVFGPMYHLGSLEDKSKALSEAARVTKKGGYILVAYIMNDYSVVVYGFMEGHAKECLLDGRLDENFHTRFTGPQDLYDYVRTEDIEAVNASVPELERVKIIAADGPANYMRPAVNALDEEMYDLFIKYHLSVCERQDMIGASAHTVDILRKI